MNFIIILAMCMLQANSAESSDPGGPAVSQLFLSISQPSGWDIPETMGVIRSGPYEKAENDRITQTELTVDPDKPFVLPRHFARDGVLVLMSFRFYTYSMARLDVDGIPFAYVCFVRGKDIGTAATVSWLDPEGRGRFTELHWGSEVVIPEWVRERLSRSVRGCVVHQRN